jgi:membrane-associated phospholipid phosphatase
LSETTTGEPPRRGPRQVIARVVTEVFAPAVLAIAQITVVTVASADEVWRGVVWWGIAAVFGPGIPYLMIRRGVRRGELTDHHLGRRDQRWGPLVIAVASVTVGLALLVATKAPAPITAAFVLMLAVLALLAVVNLRWKLSAHTAIAGAVAVGAAMLFGPWLLLTAPLVVLVGWSRVQLADHTVLQVVVGGCAGAALAAAVFSLA